MKGIGRTAPYVQEALRDASLHAFDRLIALTEEVDAAALLWAGDVFDHGAPSLRAQFRLKDGAERLLARDIPVFWAHGNHDHLGSLETRMNWPPNLIQFPPGEVASYPLMRDGVQLAQVYGISYPTAAVVEPYWQRFHRDDRAPFAIAVLHANVGAQADHDNYAPARLEDLCGAGFDYWALGHIHHRAVLAEDPPVVYPGNLQGRHVREDGRKGAYVVQVDESGRVALAFRPLNPLRWETATVDCSGLASADAVEEAAMARMAAITLDPDEQGCLIRLVLTGRTPLAGGDQDWDFLGDRLSDPEPGPGFRWVEAVDVRWRKPAEPGQPEGLWAEVIAALGARTASEWTPSRLDLPWDFEQVRADTLTLLADLLDEVEPDAH